MKTSSVGIALIKRFEGLRLEAYFCPAGVLTIGYGHTSAAGTPFVSQGMKISEVEAERILVKDLQTYEEAVLRSLKAKPNQNQFDAMVSLCYNIGSGGFSKSSVARKFNAGDIAGAAEAFKLWNKGNGKVLEGLVRRRKEESALFMKPVTLNKTADIKVNTVDKIQLPPAPIPDVVPPKGTEKSIAAWIIGLILVAFAAFGAWMTQGGN
jgi:lysozyme